MLPSRIFRTFILCCKAIAKKGKTKNSWLLAHFIMRRINSIPFIDYYMLYSFVRTCMRSHLLLSSTTFAGRPMNELNHLISVSRAGNRADIHTDIANALRHRVRILRFFLPFIAGGWRVLWRKGTDRIMITTIIIIVIGVYVLNRDGTFRIFRHKKNSKASYSYPFIFKGFYTHISQIFDRRPPSRKCSMLLLLRFLWIDSESLSSFPRDATPIQPDE